MRGSLVLPPVEYSQAHTSVAAELKEHNITVNTYAPSVVVTPMSALSTDGSTRVLTHLLDSYPSRRREEWRSCRYTVQGESASRCRYGRRLYLHQNTGIPLDTKVIPLAEVAELVAYLAKPDTSSITGASAFPLASKH